MNESQSVLEEIRQREEWDNCMEIKFPAVSKNEKLARNLVGAMLLELNPRVEELSDIKTAVSEAVTNSVVHGYLYQGGESKITVKIFNRLVYIKIEDWGVGIKDIKKAREPFFTTGNSAERSGMGFTVMESFMDELEVANQPNMTGVVVEMVKELAHEGI